MLFFVCACCSLQCAVCMLFDVKLFGVCCALFVFWLYVVCGLLFGVCFLLLCVVSPLLFVWLVRVARCWLVVVCCKLFVMCRNV